MDLEVSEPIDFGSGDHQHLFRKAADAYTGGKSVRSYGTVPSTQEPQQARGNPHSKAGRRADTYVVPISPETTTDDINPGPFSETAVRRAPPSLPRRPIPGSFGPREPSDPIQPPHCPSAARFRAEDWHLPVQLPALLWDFTLLNGMLFVLLFVLIIYGIILIFIRSYVSGPSFETLRGLAEYQWLHLLYAGLGTVIFSLYLVMDVQLMVGGRHHHSDLDPEEYVFAALNIYMDIINLFLFILQLIGMGRKVLKIDVTSEM
ncbi:hypothetical protein MG293_006720 [Ovis ammon polii]|uniref:Uncharacterized protein n=1 Tax=Ovis ammon polii TaxID=230172 RepID=A0AAD4YEV4_OVIAM|nr:hypothetical protein MG293_006720 [Ovis ammon polii]KAI4570245.1 hypothetical protein MJT46_005762 [Ovis ammon polii x Ovis aries]